MFKGVIFDFDGVIAESVQVKSDAFVELYKPYGPGIVNNVVQHHEANGGVSRFEKFRLYHKLFLDKTISEELLSFLAKQFSDLVVEKVIDAPYVPGALEYIKNHYKQYKLFISTGTPIEEMKQILKGRNIEHFFTDVFGSPDKKTVHINNIEINYGLKSNELIFYGDSNSDLDAAKSANIPFVLIRNSFNKHLTKTFKGKIINNFIGLL